MVRSMQLLEGMRTQLCIAIPRVESSVRITAFLDGSALGVPVGSIPRWARPRVGHAPNRHVSTPQALNFGIIWAVFSFFYAWRWACGRAMRAAHSFVDTFTGALGHCVRVYAAACLGLDCPRAPYTAHDAQSTSDMTNSGWIVCFTSMCRRLHQRRRHGGGRAKGGME